MESRFVLPAGLVQRIESELRDLDSFLRAAVGRDATIETHCKGSPGREIELERGDGLVVATTICPLLASSVDAAPLQYIVAVLAWAEVGGKRHHWRNGPEWTVSLSSVSERQAAERVITEAWRQALAIDRAEVMGNGGAAAWPGRVSADEPGDNKSP